MKRFLSAGEGYGPFLTNINYRVPRCFPAWRSSIFYTIGLFFMCLQAAVATGAAPATEVGRAVFFAADSIRPLQIGDTIPEALWDLPLQVVNHPEGREVITLGEYRGKIVLLDFLSSGCVGCIEAIPRLDTVMQQFSGGVIILPITAESRERMERFVPHNAYTKSASFPFVVRDQILKAHFPHQYISHVVWIDHRGVVRAATGTAHVRIQTLQEMGQDLPLDWPVKTEMTDYFQTPLAMLRPGSPNNNKRPFFYSMVTGYTEGVGSYVPTAQDSLLGVKRFSLRNRSVLDLYLIAVDRLYKLGAADIVLEVADPSAYDIHRADLSWQTAEQWQQRHAICYESTVPLDAPRSYILKKMQDDLNRFLQLDGRLESRDGRVKFILSQGEHF